MSFRRAIRSQVTGWISGAYPGLVVSAPSALKLGEDSFEGVGGVVPCYAVVATTSLTATSPEGDVLMGTPPQQCVEPVVLTVVIQLYVASDREQSDDHLDDLEASIWKQIKQKLDGGCYLDFDTGETQYPDAGSAQTRLIRTLSFSVVGLFDPDNPSRLTPQA